VMIILANGHGMLTGFTRPVAAMRGHSRIIMGWNGIINPGLLTARIAQNQSVNARKARPGMSDRVHSTVSRKRGRPRKPQSTIERYQCPERFKSLAEKRTKNIRKAWSRWGDDSLAMLCQSCYLQGIEDAFKSLEKESEAGDE